MLASPEPFYIEDIFSALASALTLRPVGAEAAPCREEMTSLNVTREEGTWGDFC